MTQNHIDQVTREIYDDFDNLDDYDLLQQYFYDSEWENETALSYAKKLLCDHMKKMGFTQAKAEQVFDELKEMYLHDKN